MLHQKASMLVFLLCTVLLCGSLCTLAEEMPAIDAAEVYDYSGKIQEVGEVDLFQVTLNRDNLPSTITEQDDAESESNADYVEISEKNFPDWTFRNMVKSYIDLNRDGKLSTAEINSVETVIILSEINSLKGIEYFTKLKELYCSCNKLTTLDISKCKELRILDCGWNSIKKLNLQNNKKLEMLNCENNKITQLDISKCTALQVVECDNNKLSKLALGKHPKLQTLHCNDNQLKSLNVSKCTALIDLQCKNNKLKSLTLGKHKKLRILYAENNNLKTIDITSCPKLKKLAKGKLDKHNSYFFWSDQSLSIDLDTVLMSKKAVVFPPAGSAVISPAYFPDTTFRDYLENNIDNGDKLLTSKELKAVRKLNVSTYSGIKSLKGIEYFSNLELLDCQDEKLTALDISSNTKLVTLLCNKNKLKSLNLKKNKSLSKLQCEGNKIKTIDITNNAQLIQLLGKECVVQEDYLEWGKEKLTIDIGVKLTAGGKRLYPDEHAITINQSIFPDEYFREYIEEYIDNGDQYLSPNECNGVKEIDIKYYDCTSLKGIEYFHNLEKLNCSGNELTSLDLNENKSLVALDCTENNITDLRLSGCTALRKLECEVNNLESFDVSSLPEKLRNLALTGKWNTNDYAVFWDGDGYYLSFSVDITLYDDGRIIYQEEPESYDDEE